MNTDSFYIQDLGQDATLTWALTAKEITVQHYFQNV